MSRWTGCLPGGCGRSSGRGRNFASFDEDDCWRRESKIRSTLRPHATHRHIPHSIFCFPVREISKLLKIYNLKNDA
jgi:hypothetical protein